MIAKIQQWPCASGADANAAQPWLIAVSMLGSTLILTAIWMWVAITYRDPQIRQYVLAFLQFPLLAGLIMTLPLRSLKGRSRAMQSLLMSGAFIATIAWCLIVGFVASAL
jgi:hypothetical protein